MPNETRALIKIFVDSRPDVTVAAATSSIVSDDASSRPPPSPLLVPSSLRQDDPLLVSVTDQLNSLGVLSSCLVPDAGWWSIIRGGSPWTTVALEIPDLPPRRIRLPAPLVDAAHRWILCDIDRLAKTGPFVLDLWSRFLHPRDRLRHLGDRSRESRVAEVNLGIRPSWCMIAASIALRRLVAVTADVIAAELFALALSETALGSNLGLTGPWEDPVVQRATELELGVPVPDHIELSVQGDADDVAPIIEAVAYRMGIRPNASCPAHPRWEIARTGMS